MDLFLHPLFCPPLGFAKQTMSSTAPPLPPMTVHACVFVIMCDSFNSPGPEDANDKPFHCKRRELKRPPSSCHNSDCDNDKNRTTWWSRFVPSSEQNRGETLRLLRFRHIDPVPAPAPASCGSDNGGKVRRHLDAWSRGPREKLVLPIRCQPSDRTIAPHDNFPVAGRAIGFGSAKAHSPRSTTMMLVEQLKSSRERERECGE